ncbi:MAG TPA: GTPase Era [Paludibacteraceae bacterium]|nr:GTPase Era [Paludibacteraceae bacterium]HOV84439.1 GTPase Era [Paludibacteraceae bacterium]
MHRAGFVNVIGNPNVGKSSLINELVGDRISIVTSKSQTTRHRILGIVNEEDFQIIYSDTPGVLIPKYGLQVSMLQFSRSALTDADVLIYVTDVFDQLDKNIDFINAINQNPAPLIVIINKIDLIDQHKLEMLVENCKNIFPRAEILPVSVLHKFNIEPLKKRIKELLPESPPFFDKDQLTDKPERFFVSEIIREKILLHYEKEIPYSVEVEIEKFTETEKIIHISAIIYVERDSQKGILIGQGGKALKRVGIEARKDIEAFFSKKVFLQLFVKVEKDWRNKEKKLKDFGYQIE